MHLLAQGAKNANVTRQPRPDVIAWVGSEILPHEADVRVWLKRMLAPHEVDDVIQEAYCQLARLEQIGHIKSGRAYFFTTARNIVLMQLRRARVVRIDSVTEIDDLSIVADEPSPERIAAGRRELERVRRLIGSLPERCRTIFELRKIEGLSQREVAGRMGVTEHIVENDVAKGLKLILQAISEGDRSARQALEKLEHDDQSRNSTTD